jgi:nitrite reductase (NADH) small subunit
MASEGNWVRICGVGELPPEGSVTEVEVGGGKLCVAKLHGKVAVLDNTCTHRGGPLGQGYIAEGNVICPWHAYGFNLVTGACANDPEERVRVFEVNVSGDDVLVKTLG